MAEDMNISVNGQSRVPPGFRFHPTEEELLHYYLLKKVSFQTIDLDVIRDVDLNKLEPWDIQEKCRIGNSPQNDWYFFCHKDKKYPTGTRTNRATAAGFWKATGRDKMIYSHGKGIGMRKTLVFYKGRAPHGQKSDWIMHEYRLEDDLSSYKPSVDQAAQEDGLVVCRVFKKKTNSKALDRNSSSSSINTDMKPHDFDVLDQIANDGSFEQIFDHKAQSLAIPTLTCFRSCYQPMIKESESSMIDDHLVGTKPNESYPDEHTLTHWSAFDHLVAYHLNGPNEADKPYDDHDPLAFRSFDQHQIPSPSPDQQQDNVDLWHFSPSSLTTSSDPLRHVPNYSI